MKLVRYPEIVRVDAESQHILEQRNPDKFSVIKAEVCDGKCIYPYSMCLFKYKTLAQVDQLVWELGYCREEIEKLIDLVITDVRLSG